MDIVVCEELKQISTGHSVVPSARPLSAIAPVLLWLVFLWIIHLASDGLLIRCA